MVILIFEKKNGRVENQNRWSIKGDLMVHFSQNQTKENH